MRGWLGLASEGAKGGRPASANPVIVASVSEARDDLTFDLVGTGRANRSVMIRAKGSGAVMEANLAAGGRLQAGDIAIRLDDEAERNQLALAEARLEDAQTILERQEKLIASGVATTARVDEARTAARIAALEVEDARRALADRIVRAPFDGVSGLPMVEVGDRVEADEELASFDDMSALLVEFDLPEALLSRIESGLSVIATTPAHEGERFEGAISAIDTRIDPESRTVKVRVTFPNEDGRLRPGASYTVSLQLPGETYPTVPELALQFSSGGLHAWRVTGETVEKVELRLVRRLADAVLVAGDLNPGDRVVIEGTQRLSPGKPIRIVGGEGS